MNAKLVVITGRANRREVPLKLPTTVGRARDQRLSILHPMVSRRHCEIYEKDGLLRVRDLESANGTFIGEERVTDAVLHPGDRLTIGPLVFEAIYQAPAKPKAKPAVKPAPPAAPIAAVAAPVEPAEVDDLGLGELSLDDDFDLSSEFESAPAAEVATTEPAAELDLGDDLGFEDDLSLGDDLALDDSLALDSPAEPEAAPAELDELALDDLALVDELSLEEPAALEASAGPEAGVAADDELALDDLGLGDELSLGDDLALEASSAEPGTDADLDLSSLDDSLALPDSEAALSLDEPELKTTDELSAGLDDLGLEDDLLAEFERDEAATVGPLAAAEEPPALELDSVDEDWLAEPELDGPDDLNVFADLDNAAAPSAEAEAISLDDFTDALNEPVGELESLDDAANLDELEPLTSIAEPDAADSEPDLALPDKSVAAGELNEFGLEEDFDLSGGDEPLALELDEDVDSSLLLPVDGELANIATEEEILDIAPEGESLEVEAPLSLIDEAEQPLALDEPAPELADELSSNLELGEALVEEPSVEPSAASEDEFDLIDFLGEDVKPAEVDVLGELESNAPAGLHDELEETPGPELDSDAEPKLFAGAMPAEPLSDEFDLEFDSSGEADLADELDLEADTVSDFGPAALGEVSTEEPAGAQNSAADVLDALAPDSDAADELVLEDDAPLEFDESELEAGTPRLSIFTADESAAEEEMEVDAELAELGEDDALALTSDEPALVDDGEAAALAALGLDEDFEPSEPKAASDFADLVAEQGGPEDLDLSDAPVAEANLDDLPSEPLVLDEAEPIGELEPFAEEAADEFLLDDAGPALETEPVLELESGDDDLFSEEAAAELVLEDGDSLVDEFAGEAEVVELDEFEALPADAPAAEAAEEPEKPKKRSLFGFLSRSKKNKEEPAPIAEEPIESDSASEAELILEDDSSLVDFEAEGEPAGLMDEAQELDLVLSGEDEPQLLEGAGELTPFEMDSDPGSAVVLEEDELDLGAPIAPASEPDEEVHIPLVSELESETGKRGWWPFGKKKDATPSEPEPAKPKKEKAVKEKKGFFGRKKSAEPEPVAATSEPLAEIEDEPELEFEELSLDADDANFDESAAIEHLESPNGASNGSTSGRALSDAELDDFLKDM